MNDETRFAAILATAIVGGALGFAGLVAGIVWLGANGHPFTAATVAIVAVWAGLFFSARYA